MKSTSTTNRTEYYKISSFIFLYFFTVCQYWTAGDLAWPESQSQRLGDWNRFCGERDILRNS